MSQTESPTGFQLRGLHVLAMIVGFFLVVIAVDTGFTIMAIRTFPGEVSVTPYEDGVAYNKKLAQLAAQDRLGWRAIAAAGAGGAVTVSFRDRAGVPVTGLAVQAKLERPATESGAKTAKFAETAPGTYVARVAGLTGAWDLSLVAHDRAGARFEAERRLTWR
ncbi:FixH family protein [Phenylobacterium sp.]|uniref:FixH family protein n=1 Tax=Phenylobacterium sp. TaxID=1871053 RepID=UPI002727388C|nr:FixH family protein [Phenylobacterium sp.]MDO8377934.1 FixH family protein [Phenylobacterium sp.]